MTYLDKYPECTGCPVHKWCGTAVSCFKLCNSYQEEEKSLDYIDSLLTQEHIMEQINAYSHE